MIFGRWRARKASIKYLRDQDIELQAEYRKIRQWEMQAKGEQPPTYNDMRANSGESLESSRWQPQERYTNGEGPSRIGTRRTVSTSTSSSNAE